MLTTTSPSSLECVVEFDGIDGIDEVDEVDGMKTLLSSNVEYVL